jgi:tetratricopeptide (TPR) repeat protein
LAPPSESIATLRRSAVDARERRDAHRSGNMFYAVVGAREFLALALASTGEFASAKVAADEAIAIAASIDDPLREVAAARGLGLTLVELGDFDAAIPWLEKTRSRCEREHFELMYSLIAGALGYAYAMTGRAAEGAAMIDEAIARRKALRGAYPGAYGAYLHSRLAEALIIDERIQEAKACVERVTDLARRYDNRVDEAWSLRLAGDLAVRGSRRDVEAAEAHYLRSRAIAARLGMAPFVAHCDRKIGSLAAFGLDDERCGAALERARTEYTRLAMPYWLMRTEEVRMRAGGVE